MNVFLMPLWLLSGALFPAGADSWARYAVALNPVAYGTAAVRRAFYGDAVYLASVPSYAAAMIVSAVFAIVMFLLAVWMVRRKRSIA
jgi:ABC-type polysaccharide/polyol phosphate export permease